MPRCFVKAIRKDDFHSTKARHRSAREAQNRQLAHGISAHKPCQVGAIHPRASMSSNSLYAAQAPTVELLSINISTFPTATWLLPYPWQQLATTQQKVLLNLSSAQWGLRFGDLLWFYITISQYGFVQNPHMKSLYITYGPYGDFYGLYMVCCGFLWFCSKFFGTDSHQTL